MENDGGSSLTIRLDLAYEGTDYHGFGVQPGQRTIQEVLEEALARSLGEQVRVTVAGRTDAGVHASGQVVSFTTRGRLSPETLMRAANARLPEDVLVTAAAEAPHGWDARRSAIRRHYRYHVWSQRLPSLWWRRWAWRQPGGLDLDAMQIASQQLLGTHDFASFLGHRAQEPAGRTTIRTVERAEWRRDGSLIGFDITANAFLRHMVRGIVGTLIEVGRGRLDPAHFGKILAAQDRTIAGQNAPPHGLILMGVDYPAQTEQMSHSQEQADFVEHETYPGPVGRLGDGAGSRSSVVIDAIGGRDATRSW